MKTKKIVATQGRVFRRKQDGVVLGNEVVLTVDFSTGNPRRDREDYYEEIDTPTKEAIRQIIRSKKYGTNNTNRNKRLRQPAKRNNPLLSPTLLQKYGEIRREIRSPQGKERCANAEEFEGNR